MSQEYIQSLITKFTHAAGLEKNYTTHCFRRGGAQYRFMFAPVGERWSLNVIRWWGGWAKGEHVRSAMSTDHSMLTNSACQVDTLMKYLFDSLQNYESSHSDALCPIQDEPDQSFMGDQKALQPLTNHEFRHFSTSIFDTMNSLKTTLELAMQGGISLTGTGNTPPIIWQHPNLSPGTPVHPGSSSGGAAWPVMATDSAPPSQLLASAILAASGSNNGHTLNPFPVPSSSVSTHRMRQSKSSQQRLAPLPGAVIPDIPRGPTAWKIAVKQWDDFLKDWEPWKYTGKMRLVNGTKRSLRETITLEYDACVGFQLRLMP